jgi:hypothetical protein
MRNLLVCDRSLFETLIDFASLLRKDSLLTEDCQIRSEFVQSVLYGFGSGVVGFFGCIAGKRVGLKLENSNFLTRRLSRFLISVFAT